MCPRVWLGGRESARDASLLCRASSGPCTAGTAPWDGSCGFCPSAYIAIPAITTGNMSSLGITLSDLRNIHGIVGLQLYILRCVLALDHILVIEGEPGSRAIRVLPQHIN